MEIQEMTHKRTELTGGDEEQDVEFALIQIDHYSLRGHTVHHVCTYFEDRWAMFSLLEFVSFFENHAQDEALFINGRCVQRGLLSPASIDQIECDFWPKPEEDAYTYNLTLVQVERGEPVVFTSRSHTHSERTMVTILNDSIRDAQYRGYAIFYNGKCMQAGELTPGQIEVLENSWK